MNKHQITYTVPDSAQPAYINASQEGIREDLRATHVRISVRGEGADVCAPHAQILVPLREARRFFSDALGLTLDLPEEDASKFSHRIMSTVDSIHDGARLDFLIDAISRDGDPSDDPDMVITATCIASGLSPRDAIDTAIKAKAARG